MATSAQTVSGGALDLNIMRKERSLWSDAWARLRRNRASMGGLILIVLFTLVAIFAPLLAPYSPVQQSANNSLRQPAWVQTGDPSKIGRSDHLLGTDAIGRDILSQLIFGTRVSLIVGFIPQFIILLLGIPIGLIAGYAGGRTDNLLMR